MGAQSNDEHEQKAVHEEIVALYIKNLEEAVIQHDQEKTQKKNTLPSALMFIEAMIQGLKEPPIGKSPSIGKSKELLSNFNIVYSEDLKNNSQENRYVISLANKSCCSPTKLYLLLAKQNICSEIIGIDQEKGHVIIPGSLLESTDNNNKVAKAIYEATHVRRRYPIKFW